MNGSDRSGQRDLGSPARAYAGASDARGTPLGSMNPVAMSQMKLGNLVSGIKNKAWGATKFSQLSSPHTANASPKPATHFGRSFMNHAGTDAPASKRPMGTEKPGPPKAYERYTLLAGGWDPG